MNEATKQKRQQLLHYIEREIQSEKVCEEAVQGVVAVGSVAAGTARPDSDIDAVIFLSPFDLYAVPAECKWQPETGTFYGISCDIGGAIQLDLKRFDLTQWTATDYPWPEPIRAELQAGWIAFDRNGQLEKLIADRTAFTAIIRQTRLDEAVVHLDQLLDSDKAERTWHTLGPAAAHDRLHAAYHYLVQALFAYNRRWRTWQSRELSHLLQLPWLPNAFGERVLSASNALSETNDGYRQRLDVLTELFGAVVTRCQKDGLYGESAVGEAFIRQHDEPGRDWNMDEWVQSHEQRN